MQVRARRWEKHRYALRDVGGEKVRKWCERQRPPLPFHVAANKMLQLYVRNCMRKHTRAHTNKGQVDFLIDWGMPCSDVSAGFKMNELTYEGKEKEEERKGGKNKQTFGFKISEVFIMLVTGCWGGWSVFIKMMWINKHLICSRKYYMLWRKRHVTQIWFFFVN